MARPHLSFLSPQEKELVHEQTVRVLEQVGIGFNSARAIALLEAAGAPVDHQKLTARIPRELLERCLRRRRGAWSWPPATQLATSS